MKTNLKTSKYEKMSHCTSDWSTSVVTMYMKHVNDPVYFGNENDITLTHILWYSLTTYVIRHSTCNISFCHHIQISAGAQPDSYLMGTRGSFSRDKAATA
jgi:hypothetical protein